MHAPTHHPQPAPDSHPLHFDVHRTEWDDPHGTIGEEELARASGLSPAQLEELVDYGLLAPVGGVPSALVFSAACVQPLREANALRNRFDLDVFVAGLMFSQLERIAQLEQQVRTLQGHAPHPGLPRDGPSPWREPHA